MGCWNGTCMLSNLPIRCGQKVKFVILVKNQFVDSAFELNGCCYPTDEYKVLSPVLTGKYNDYGSIENLDKTSAKYVKDLEKDLRIAPDKYEDVMVNIERGLVTFNAKGFVKTPDQKVAFVMFHEEIYNSIIEKKLISWKDKEITDKELLKWFAVGNSGKRIDMFKEMIDIKYLEVAKLCHILACARMRFYLPSGSGSQDDDMKFQKIISKATLNFKEPTYN